VRIRDIIAASAIVSVIACHPTATPLDAPAPPAQATPLAAPSVAAPEPPAPDHADTTPAPSAEPGRSGAEIDAIMLDHAADLDRCLEVALTAHPEAFREGHLVLAWTIEGTGRAVDIAVRSGGGGPQLPGCLRHVVEKIRFPLSARGERTPAEYTFAIRH
jgi:hypothetical protein